MQIQFAALLFACFFAGLFALTAGTTSHAATTLPTKMNFQGRVTNSAGNILSNGTYNMKFRIWSAASGGTQQWSEDRLVSAGQGVTVTNGQFSVQLGSVTSLPASIFASNSLYFEIELPTPASATGSSPVWSEGAMTPRNQLATSAYAFNSETLDGLDSAAFGQLDQNNVFTGNNTFNGTLQGGSSLTLGTTNVAGSLVISDGSSNTGTIAMAPTAGNYTYTIPVTTANDTFCLQTLANCADGGVTTVGALDGGTANATGASIVGTTIYLQSASAANAGLVNTTTQSFAGNKTFTGTVAVSGTTTLNDNVTVAANKTIQYVGGATASRPAAPGEGTTFYDTDTKQLLVYANGKWNADKSSSTKIVAASNSSQSLKDAADYVADGNTAAANDGDQVEINNALTAAAGGRVYLAEGTYTIDASISVPDNTTLAGSGQGTVITIPNALNTNFKAIVNSGSVTLTIQDLRLDGNKANQSGANFGMAGIVLSGMNTGSGSSVRRGPLIQNVNSSQWYVNGSVIQCSNSGVGICLSTTRYATIADSFTNGNRDGIYITGSPSYATVSGHVGFSNDNGVRLDNVSYATIESSTFHSNISNGIAAFTAANYNNINGNNIYANAIGVSVSGANNNFSGNTSQGNTGAGFSVSGNNNLFSANTAYDNGGATTNNGFSITSSGSGNSIIGNTIGDTSATTNNYAITITSANASSTYLSGNVLGSGSINDVSSSTVYASQVDASGSLINRNQGGVSVGKTTAGTTLDVQGAIRNVALSTPTAPTLSTSGTAGSTTYGYRVSALDGLGETLASTEATIATGNATLSATDYVNITWPQVGGAVQYKVYRSTSAGTPSSTGLIRTVAGNVLTTTDTGLAASGSVAASNTTGGASFGGAMQGGSSLTLGTSSVQGSLVLNDGNGQTGTIRMADIAGNYTYTIPVTTANDTFCLQTLANCAAGVTTVGALDGGSANATGASIVGTTIYLQSASTGNAGLVNTTTQSFAGNKTFTGTVTVSGATTFNENVTVAASKTIQFVGGATGTRPVSPGEGAVYYDQTTKKLLTYTSSRWQSDGSDAILVAASNSSQADKDVADYVADGDTIAAGDGDQVQIQSALTAGSGKKVILLAGTYVVDATILMPNNTILTGVGDGTLIELSDIDATDNMIENSDTSTGTKVSVQNLRIDGRSDLNTAGVQTAVKFSGMGGGSGSTARLGGMISNLNISRMRNDGLEISASAQNTITDNYTRNNGGRGFYFPGSSVNNISNNIAQGNTGGGFLFNGTNTNNTITSNTAQGNSSSGFQFSQTTKSTLTGNTSSGNTWGIFMATSTTNNTVTGNTLANNSSAGMSIGAGSDGTSVTGNTISATAGNGIDVGSDNVSVGTNSIDGSTSSGIQVTGDNVSVAGNTVTASTLYGISLNTSDNSTVTGNKLVNNGGATTNNGIHIFTSDNTNVSGNSISDASASSNNYAINVNNSTSDATYLSGNTLGGGSINNAGTATIFANQVDASGNMINRNQGGMSIGKTTASASLDIQGALQNIALSTPTAPTLSTTGTAGSTTYGYRVSALDGLGETLASAETTIATGNATLTAGNYINITWPQVGGAVQYKIFRSTSGGTPATTGLIRTVAGNVQTTTDTGLAASGSVAASNTTGGASFGGAIQGGSSLSLGTATAAGSLVISDGSSNAGTIVMAPTAGNYTYTIPVTTANDTFCLVTLANCTGAGGGVTAVGALDGGTANATGASIVGTTIYLQSASATNAGLVNTTTQSFAGNKTFTGALAVSAGAPPAADMLSISNAGQGVTSSGVSGLQINYVGGAAAIEASGARIDLTPGSTSGGTWNGLRIVTNGTGAASGVSMYGIKIEGPTSPGAGTEIGLRVASGFDIGLDIASGGLKVAAITTNNGEPTDTLAAGDLRVYAKTNAGRTMLKMKNSTEGATSLQPFLGSNKIGLYQANGNGTTASIVGLPTPTLVSNAGSTLVARTVASTNLFTAVRRGGLATTATAGTLGSFRLGANMFFRGNGTAGVGGYYYVVRGGIATSVSGQRVYVGMNTITAAATNVEPSSLVNSLGFGCDAADTSFTFMHNDGTGTAVKDALTGSFPCNTSGADLYEFRIYAPSNSSTVFYSIARLNSTDYYEGSTSTDIPVNTTLVNPQMYITNNATASAAAFDLSSIYIETDN